MNNLHKLSILAAASLLMVGCADDNPWVGQQGKGGIVLSLAADANVADAVPETRATESLSAPDVNQFAIRLTKEDFSFDKTYANVDEFNAADGFGTGVYTVSAFYGDPAEEGFDKPAFYGEAPVNVLEGEASSVKLTATLANTMVSIDFTDAFKTFFPAYSAILHSDAGALYQTINAEDAARPVFLAPGNVSITLNITQPNTGRETSIQPAEPFEARARHHYHVTLDYNHGEVGEGQIVISFDDSVEAEDVDVDLTDELFTSPAPVVTPAGFTSGTTISFLQGSATEQPVKFNVNAAGRIKEANLSVISQGKTFTAGKTEIDLVSASEADQALLKSWGLNCAGFFKVPERFAFVDLSEFLRKLPEGIHTVSLQVKDIMTHVSEPVTFTVEVEPVQMAMKPLDAVFGEESMSLEMEYNGSNAKENFTFKYLNNSGNYVDAPVIACQEVTRSRAAQMKTYKFTVKTPKLDRATGKIQMFFCGEMKDEQSFNIVVPKYTVEVDAHATFFDVKVQAEDAKLTPSVTNALRLFIKGDMDGTPTFTRNAEAGLIRAYTAIPATAYTLTTTLDTSSKPVISTTTDFTTEATLAVPNGDFSNIAQTININPIDAGGKYKYGASTMQNKSSILVSEPASWASINAKTAFAGANPANTWFVVPSTLALNGAVTLRSVAYDHNGKLPELDNHGLAVRKKYSRNAPASFAATAAGELFLGSYSFNGSEQRSEGVAFAARPVSVSFDYTYAGLDGEKGVAYVKVLDASGSVIAEKTEYLENAAQYAQKTVTMPAYPFGKKPSKLVIGFKSSNVANPKAPVPGDLEDVSNTTSLSGQTIQTNNYKSLATGSVLTVDNVSVSYDINAAAARKFSNKSIKRARK